MGRAKRWAAVGTVAAAALFASAGSASAQQSVARQWNEQLIGAIRRDSPRPPIHARNLYHVSAAMWDAWAAYDAQADQVFHHERAIPPVNMTVAQLRDLAISQAAFRLIKHRYQNATGAAATLASLNQKLLDLGMDPNFVDTVGDTPTALGNRIFETIRAMGLADGSNEQNNYARTNGYFPVNLPLVFSLSGTHPVGQLETIIDPNRWQPLAFSYFVEQNGNVIGATVQTFVCPHWNSVTSFALVHPAPGALYFDPGPPPLLGTATDAQFKAEFEQVVEFSAALDPTQGVMMDISPATHHNNPLGTNSGTGYGINPVTGLPYTPEIVNAADYYRCLAEFWADGPQSETPPGHWNVVANDMSDSPLVQKRIGGVGPVCGNLEWDVKMYLALNGAEHDAACAAWGIKGVYDSARPISTIRWLAERGQSSDPELPNYSPLGLPLIPGLVELITEESTQPGERHEHLAAYIGEVAIRSWRGQPADPQTQIGGVGWIRAMNWNTYQKTTFVTPPFAGYISGHSTYSRAGAETLAGLTGTPYFPGGLSTYTLHQNQFLQFEEGPTTDIVLSWATYYDAADEAGISRLYGGIHIAADDFNGRITGSKVGKIAWTKAARYYNGRVSCFANYNGLNGVTVQDIYDYLSDWNNQVQAADTNLSGTVTVQDIYDFLGMWNAGCS